MSSRVRYLIAALAVVVVAIGGAVWWFFDDEAPDEVSLEAAVESVDGRGVDDGAGATDGDTPVETTVPEASGSEASGSEAAGVPGDVAGTWTVDNETGEFDYETATGTFAGFRIAEELATVGATTAVGRTGDVTGSATIDGTTLTAAAFEVDLTTITTNDSRRDDRVQDALETGTHPTATFTLTQPVELGDAAAGSGPVSVVAPGELTIHGVTRSIEFPIEAQLVEDTIVVVGSLDVAFSDYDVEVPQAPIVLSAADEGTLELQLLLVRS